MEFLWLRPILLSLFVAAVLVYFGFKIAHKQDTANRVIRAVLFIVAVFLFFGAVSGGGIYPLLLDPLFGSTLVGASIALGIVFSAFFEKVVQRRKENT